MSERADYTGKATTFFGLSSEDKPTDVSDNTVFYEVDTRRVFIFYKGNWYEQ